MVKFMGMVNSADNKHDFNDYIVVLTSLELDKDDRFLQLNISI